MSPKDALGKRGEALFVKTLTDPWENGLPYFDPYFLGEKCPTFDFLVRLVGVSEPMFFLAQVKTTLQRNTKQQPRLKVTLDADDVKVMTSSAIPVYLFAIDGRSEVAYIWGIHDLITG